MTTTFPALMFLVFLVEPEAFLGSVGTPDLPLKPLQFSINHDDGLQQERTARTYLEIGFTNRGLCPSEWRLRNNNREELISATIKYTFVYDTLLQRQPEPQFEVVSVAPGQAITLRHAYTTCPLRRFANASIEGAYFGR